MELLSWVLLTAIGANRAKEAIIAALDSPLLDDNKITGAKNVLLLIVSGSNEITIDDIRLVIIFKLKRVIMLISSWELVKTKL